MESWHFEARWIPVRWSNGHGPNMDSTFQHRIQTPLGKLVEFWMWRHLESPGIHVLASWAKVCYPRSIPILACKTTWALAGSVSCKPPATPTSPWQLQRIARDTHDIGCRLVMTCIPKLHYNSKMDLTWPGQCHICISEGCSDGAWLNSTGWSKPRLATKFLVAIPAFQNEQRLNCHFPNGFRIVFGFFWAQVLEFCLVFFPGTICLVFTTVWN